MDQFMVYGLGWVETQYKLCMEAMRMEYTLLLGIFPLARSPMDKKGARAMSKYAKDVHKDLAKTLTPWNTASTRAANRASKYGGKVKPGEVTVILGPGEGGLADIFKDSKIAKV